jgi:hypothetical protein
MDSKDRDEAKIRRRQELLARRVGEALDRMKPHGEEDCPDAEVIASYSEQALGPAESAEWEGHFAACARCRKILRVLAASTDTPLAEKEVAQLGKLVSAVRAPVEITGRSAVSARPRFVDWRTRWLAPAIGVAAVLAVWFAMRPPWRATDRGASETLVAQAPKEEMPSSPAPAELDQLSNRAPQQDRKTVPAPPPDRLAANAAPLNLPAGAPPERRSAESEGLGKVLPNADLVTNSLQKEKKLEVPSDKTATPAPAPLPPPPPFFMAGAGAEPSAASNQAPGIGGGSGGAESRDKQATQRTVGGIVMPELPPRAAMGTRSSQSISAFKATTETPAFMKTPSGSTIWRAGKGGRIERSTDEGRTWATQESPTQEDWLAVAAVSDTVGWLAGRNGAIARTMDGEHWERVPPPVQSAGTDVKLPDWTGITARDALSATVTANDGRKFATADGGKTWQLQ